MASKRVLRFDIYLMHILFLAASLAVSSNAFIHPLSQARTSLKRPPTCLAININSDDPFEILDLNEPTTDQKVIKRAYKRMALQYHPDVVSTPQSSPEEKKKASDRFAKINWAYSQLSGKGADNQAYSAKSTTQKASTTGGWTPPHRRSSGSQGGTRGGDGSVPGAKQNVDWSDFIPKSDERYDTNGDSFGKIFSDLFAGATSSAVSGAAGSTLFKDFIEFLEGNVDGFGSTGGSDDSELQYLLERGTKTEIRNELDDTKLVVDQLTRKLRGIETEISSASEELSETEKYLEKIRLEEIIAELSARKNVVKGYLQKAEQRLLRLQMRFKDLKRSDSRWDETKQDSEPSSYSSTKGATRSAQESSSRRRGSDASWQSGGYDSTSPGGNGKPTTSKDDDQEQSWKKEGFGSSARRGSRRRQSAEFTSKQTADSENFSSSDKSTPNSDQSWRSEGFGSSRRPRRRDRDTQSQRPSTAGTATGRSDRDRSKGGRSSEIAVGASNSSTDSVPPHRRRTSPRSVQDDSKKRLREIIVDEEFEKLKRELGL